MFKDAAFDRASTVSARAPLVRTRGHLDIVSKPNLHHYLVQDRKDGESSIFFSNILDENPSKFVFNPHTDCSSQYIDPYPLKRTQNFLLKIPLVAVGDLKKKALRTNITIHLKHLPKPKSICIGGRVTSQHSETYRKNEVQPFNSDEINPDALEDTDALFESSQNCKYAEEVGQAIAVDIRPSGHERILLVKEKKIKTENGSEGCFRSSEQTCQPSTSKGKQMLEDHSQETSEITLQSLKMKLESILDTSMERKLQKNSHDEEVKLLTSTPVQSHTGPRLDFSDLSSIPLSQIGVQASHQNASLVPSSPHSEPLLESEYLSNTIFKFLLECAQVWIDLIEEFLNKKIAHQNRLTEDELYKVLKNITSRLVKPIPSSSTSSTNSKQEHATTSTEVEIIEEAKTKKYSVTQSSLLRMSDLVVEQVRQSLAVSVRSSEYSGVSKSRQMEESTSDVELDLQTFEELLAEQQRKEEMENQHNIEALKLLQQELLNSKAGLSETDSER